jgi:hypothetical protein
VSVSIEPVTIAGVAGFRINGVTLCVVKLSRPDGASAAMYGCRAEASQVDTQGQTVPGPVGVHTEAVLKSALVPDPVGVAAAVASRATLAAIEALANEIAVRAANQAVGI